MPSLVGPRTLLSILAGLAVLGCSQPQADPPVTTAQDLADGTTPVAAMKDADVTLVKLETTEGDVLIEVHPEWAPKGAERFLTLVENGFYDGVKFFRNVEGFMVQVGINGDPELHAKWKDNNIPDDPVKVSNKPGYVTFATSGPNSRSTQFFINFGDNGFLDGQGFSPFGRVVEGMEVVRSLYNGYGESPDQFAIVTRGNAYLEENFPELDAIKKASVVEQPAE